MQLAVSVTSEHLLLIQKFGQEKPNVLEEALFLPHLALPQHLDQS